MMHFNELLTFTKWVLFIDIYQSQYWYVTLNQLYNCYTKTQSNKTGKEKTNLKSISLFANCFFVLASFSINLTLLSFLLQLRLILFRGLKGLHEIFTKNSFLLSKSTVNVFGWLLLFRILTDDVFVLYSFGLRNYELIFSVNWPIPAVQLLELYRLIKMLKRLSSTMKVQFSQLSPIAVPGRCILKWPVAFVLTILVTVLK